jgi:predicted aspartyl protease
MMKTLMIAAAGAFLIATSSTSDARESPTYPVFSDCIVDLQKGGGVHTPSYWASITLSSSFRAAVQKRITIKVLVDTGFSGALSLPRPLVNYLRANSNVINDHYNINGKTTTQLADGSIVENNILYTSGEVAFPGCERVGILVPIIIANDGATPLIGQELLSAYKSANIDHENLQLILKAYPLDLLRETPR